MQSIPGSKRIALIGGTWVLTCLMSLSAEAQPKSGSVPTIQGAWRIVEVTTTGPTAATNKNPQPGLVLFTAKHYSIMRISSEKPRPELKDAANVTPDEALAVWKPFQANSGTYEMSGSTLTTHIVVAKDPENLRGNGGATYSYHIDGSVLMLTATGYNTRQVSNPTTWKLVRAE